MKILTLLFTILFNLTLFAQESAQYFHDGSHHYIVNGEDVSEYTPSILLENEVIFEYDAKIYIAKNTDAIANTGEKITAELLNDRSKLKAWGIDFYVERNGIDLFYYKNNFQIPESIFLGPDSSIYGYGNGYYFRLNNYYNRQPNAFEEIFMYEYGLWWEDDKGQLYALQNGQSFQGTITPFKKGYFAENESTEEYFWLPGNSSTQQANKVYVIEKIPVACAINVSTTGRYFIPKPIYKGKVLSSESLEIEVNDNKTMYYFDPQLKKAFIGDIPEAGQIMDLNEITIPKSSSNAYWIKDNKGIVYLQIGDDIWEETIIKKGHSNITATKQDDGNFYEFTNMDAADPMVLYPAIVYQ